MASKNSAPLAPAPPEISPSYFSQQTQQPNTAYSLDSQTMMANTLFMSALNPPRKSLTTETEGKECRLKDRFDRKAVLAYEWDRSRVSLDVNGLGFGWDGFSDVEEIKLEYRLRLQPEKPPREKCRYASHWQGIVGSGYNEFFVREENTVWEDLKKVKEKAGQYIETTF